MNRARLIKITLSPLIVCLLLIASANIIILSASQGRLHNELETIAPGRLGLVLGCPPTVINGSPNAYFEQRMDAAARLVHTGRVSSLVLSGATDGGAYNEPRAMFKALLKRGLHKKQLQLDDQGNRTFDSLNNLRQLRPDSAIVIISQQAHARRALFIARHLDMDAIAYNAQSQDFSDTLIQMLRESLARVRAIADITLYKTVG